MGSADLARQLIAEADRYEAAAKKLRDAASILSGENGVNGQHVATNGHIDRKPKKNSRLAQVRQFLLEHGPSPRRDILAETGIPVGSVATVLTEKNFNRDGEGLWSVREDENEDNS